MDPEYIEIHGRLRLRKTTVIALFRAALVVTPLLALCLSPVLVYRCRPVTGAAQCTIEERAAGLIVLTRTEVAGIRAASGSTVATRSLVREPGSDRIYTRFESSWSLDLLGPDGRLLYRERRTNPVGRGAERLAESINETAGGGRTGPLLAWSTNWPAALLATLLLLAWVPDLCFWLWRHLQGAVSTVPPAGGDAPRLKALLLVSGVLALSWALALLGGFPAGLARAFGLTPGE